MTDTLTVKKVTMTMLNAMTDVNKARTETTNPEGEMMMNDTLIEIINPTKGKETMNENESKENSIGTTQQGEIRTLALSEIHERKDLRCRVSEDEKAIVSYAKSFRENKIARDRGKPPLHDIPPIKVWYNEGRYYLLGGFHRVAAAIRAGCDMIQAEVFYVSEDEAFEIALADNKHGERLKIDAAFDIHFDNKSNSFYELVEQGYLTIEQLITIKRLLINIHSLILKIDEASISEIARKRYDNPNKKINCDFDAYEQIFIEMMDRTLEPSISIKSNGRFYGAMTGMAREFWNYAFFKEQQLSGVDIKSSHVYCLLALLKDIGINYFGSEGSHEERLINCQFAKQISTIPGLLVYYHIQQTHLLLYTLAESLSEMSGKSNYPKEL